MGFERKLERQQKRAEKRAHTMLTVPVLNALNKRMEVPALYRDNILKAYGFRPTDLTGEDAFHIVFVTEGVVFCFKVRQGSGISIVMHILELDNEECIRIVGSEIYQFWVDMPTSITFEELRERYNSYVSAPAETETEGEATV